MGVWAFVFPGHKLWLPFGAFPPSISPHFKLSLSYPWAAKLGATHHSVKEQKQFLNVAPEKAYTLIFSRTVEGIVLYEKE